MTNFQAIMMSAPCKAYKASKRPLCAEMPILLYHFYSTHDTHIPLLSTRLVWFLCINLILFTFFFLSFCVWILLEFIYNNFIFINNIIWKRISKIILVWLGTLKFGFYEAISSFSQGNITKCISKNLPLTQGVIVEAMIKGDRNRIYISEFENLHKEVRQVFL